MLICRRHSLCLLCWCTGRPLWPRGSRAAPWRPGCTLPGKRRDRSARQRCTGL